MCIESSKRGYRFRLDGSLLGRGPHSKVNAYASFLHPLASRLATAQVEGKGNGIKTVIVNMADIAKALNRPAAYPTKFFGTERGAQVR